MLQQLAFVTLLASTLARATTHGFAADAQFSAHDSCPDYVDYAQVPHPPFSSGPLGLPNQRPSEHCRTFSSRAVDALSHNYTSRMKDQDLAALFANALGSTLDTTIRWKNDNLTFLVTGDITAMWIRDSCQQLAHYQPLAAQDPELAKLIKGAINLQSQYLGEYPYCGAFQPPAVSGLAPTFNEWAYGATYPFPTDNHTMFECKYELDSIAGFLKLSREYHDNTGDGSYLVPSYFQTLETILDLINNQSRSTLDVDGNMDYSYAFFSERVPVVNNGVGHPARANGLVKTGFRPSDDLAMMPFHIPDNALLCVELRGLAKLLQKENQRPDLVQEARKIADRIEKAIWEHGVFEMDGFGNIFAYEVDGFGGRVFMDDANVPSLMSMPFLGFLDVDDEVYQNTRKFLMSSNHPYYAKGKAFYGIGGPHVGAKYPWPMNLATVIMTSTKDQEIVDALDWLKNSTAGLGLIHESVNIHNATDYTRPWFAWANSFTAEAIIKVAKERPHLIFK